MTGEEIDAIAEKTAAKIAQGILRMPDDLRAALAREPTGWFSNPSALMPGPNAYYLQALARPDGIELEIKRPDGSPAWRGVIV